MTNTERYLRALRDSRDPLASRRVEFSAHPIVVLMLALLLLLDATLGLYAHVRDRCPAPVEVTFTPAPETSVHNLPAVTVAASRTPPPVHIYRAPAL